MRYTLTRFRQMHEQGERIAMLTCYDASFAALCDESGVEILLVGDSLGMVIQGHDSTLAAFDNFFAWMEAEPNVRVSPDVYLLDDPPPPPWPKHKSRPFRSQPLRTVRLERDRAIELGLASPSDRFEIL